jgi:methylated-DNA-protein-cysteine methyltransferase-like protein
MAMKSVRPMSPEHAQAAIRRAVAAIPAGAVCGYGEVARRAGLPGRARLVGRTLGGADAIGLPWHRVVRSDGRIAFPAGSRAFHEQTRRLVAEGVRVEAGRVSRSALDAVTDVDAALWAPPPARRAPRPR